MSAGLLLLGVGNSGGGPPSTYSTKFTETQASGLLAYWRLNELSGTSAGAQPTTGYQGTYNGVTLNSTIAPGGGAAPSFDGVNDYIALQTTYIGDNFNGTSGTMTMWVNPSTLGFNQCFIFQGGAASTSRIYLQMSSENQIAMVRQAGGVTNVLQSSVGQSWDFTTWVHLGLTWDESDNEVQVWIDGTTAYSTGGIGAWTVSSVSTALVGRLSITSGANDFEGEMAHVALWNRTLSAADMLDLASTIV